MPEPSAPPLSQLRLLELAARNQLADEVAAGAQAGVFSARERIALLLDDGSFEETGMFVVHRAVGFGMEAVHVPGDGCVTGHGRVNGRLVCVFAQEARVLDGAVSEAAAGKICRLVDAALRVGAPLIALYGAGSVRVQEGVAALGGFAEMLRRLAQAGGVVPLVSVVFPETSDTGGTALLAPALADFALTAGVGQAGGRDTIQTVRALLAYLPGSHLEQPPRVACLDDPLREDAMLDSIIPDSDHETYDMTAVIAKIADDAVLLQIQEHHARNLIAGFARMDGRPVGIVANQPSVLNGVLDADACNKAARFVRFCDAFHISLLVFVDTPGTLAGDPMQPAATLLQAFARATVPRLTVVTRKAFSSGYCLMNPQQTGANLNLAWPSAQVAVMSPADAADAIYKHEFAHALRTARAVWPQGKAFSKAEQDAILSELREEKTDELRHQTATPWAAAERGYLDAVIRPSETRRYLNQALDRFTEGCDKPSP